MHGDYEENKQDLKSTKIHTTDIVLKVEKIQQVVQSK